jgi:hypothetical protein
MVTPCYWGSHWPLARGNATGKTIDDRIHQSPCHNSVMSWASQKPAPLSAETVETVDTLGRKRPMLVRRWAWLIGMTDAADDALRDRARSFAKPPGLTLRGARRGAVPYAPERRAIPLVVEGREVSIAIRPATPCVNPVFELANAPKGGIAVSLGGEPLDATRYAWDGNTLWLDLTLTAPADLQVSFESDPSGKSQK